MKKSFVLLVLLALATAGTAAAQSSVTGAAPTQTGRAQLSPDQIADRLTTRLTKELTLTPDQATKVRAISLANTQDMMALRQKASGGNRQGMMQNLKASKEKSDAQYKAVLTPEQFTKLQALQAERQRMRRERMQQGGGGQAGFGDF